MIGDRLLCYRLADRLGKTFSEFCDNTTFTELLDWSQYLDIVEKEPQRIDYIGASIAREVFLSDKVAEARNSTPLEGFVLKFVSQEEKQKSDAEQWEAQIKADIAHTIGILKANQEYLKQQKTKPTVKVSSSPRARRRR